jgi:hypothetical protein
VSKWIFAGLVAGLAVAAPTSTAAAQKNDRYLITIQEITDRKDVTNAYEAVQRLRSQWLKTTRSRGSLGSGASAAEGYRPVPERPPNGQAATPTPSTPADPFARMSDPRNKQKVDPVLYIDEVKQDEVEELRNIRVVEILEIKYMNGTQASGRYGAGHEAGAILLTTNRLGGKP